MSNLASFAMIPMDILLHCSGKAAKVWGVMGWWSDSNDEIRYCNSAIGKIAAKLKISRDGVERAIKELVDIGRLTVHSGKKLHKTNLYEQNYLRRKADGPSEKELEGRTIRKKTPKTQDKVYRKVAARTTASMRHIIKEVTYKSLLTPSGRPESVDFSEFWHYYPRKEKMSHAEGTWGSLSETEQIKAFVGAVRLSEIYETANSERKHYTPQPANWMDDRRWEHSDEDVETTYRQPGYFTQESAETAREEASMRQKEGFKKEQEEADERIKQARLERERNKDA